MTPDRNPNLLWPDDGSPRSGRFGDVYFSREDGLAETRAVFLQGCGLPDAWADRRRFVVGELGFGTGLNIAALLEMWRRSGPAGGRLQVFSVEGYPLSRDEAARALGHWPELAEVTGALTARWPASTPGFHRIDLPDWRATIDIAVGEVEWALNRWTGAADAWFLDGFAPSANPDMWSDAVLDRIAASSAPGARLATFTVAGAVRRGLSARGFAVNKRPGHGRKRERLEARKDGVVTDAQPTVAIVGAGIAGASLARAFRAVGVTPTIVDADGPGSGASGFPAALVTPRLDAGDLGIAALYAQALERAVDLYAQTPGAVISRGVVQLATNPRDGVRFDKVMAQQIWPDGALTRLTAAQTSARIGEETTLTALAFETALAVQPRATIEAWLASARLVRGRVSRLEQGSEGWVLQDTDGEVIARADIVVLAAGWGNAALAPGLGLSPVAGQADWVEKATGPAAAWGGYTVPTAEGGLLFGATHDRGMDQPVVSDAASRANRERIKDALPELAGRIGESGHRRVAVRATTADRLPLAGAVPEAPGLYVLGGLGSRGFCTAPLLAEHIAALIMNVPSPLPADLARRISLDRAARGREHAQRQGQ